MAIINFFSKLLTGNKYQESNHLSLVLAPDRVAALIWTFKNGQVRELGFGQKAITSLDLILHQTAVAIDVAGEEAKRDFARTVFGLSANWLEENQLSPKSTKVLKKLADELELEPQAFVPIAASTIHLLKDQTPAPQVVEIGLFTGTKLPFCEVHLIDKDKVVATRTSDLPPTLEKIKEQVGELSPDRQLPARVIIYGADPKDKIAKDLIAADWSGVFVQEPKFDFLSDRELARAVAYAQFSDLLGHEPLVEGKLPTPIPAPHHDSARPAPSPPPSKSTNELGFIEGEDILAAATKPEIPPQEGQSLSEKPLPSDEPTQAQSSSGTSLLSSLPKFSFSGQKLLMAALALLILALAATFTAGRLLTKAEVTVIVDGQEHQADFQATVKEDVDTSAQKAQIPGQVATTTATGNQKAVTTGSKKIGEKSRGEAVILNWTKAPKTFSEGTAIISKGGVKFTLESEVEVASRSASALTPGKNKVGATAVEVGESSNLSQGTEFTFVNFDEISYSAQAETNFSGGSERQVTVVTRQDMERLEKSLTETLLAKAREDLKNKAVDKLLLDDAISMKTTRTNFDKKEDEEASLLTLDMEVEARAIVFDEDDLKKLLAEIADSDIDPKLVARPQNLDIVNIKVARVEDTLTLTGDYQVRLVPGFNEDELKDQIAGKSEKAARQMVLQIAGTKDIKITYSPNLPLVGSLPKNSKKITIKIETSQ